jgi:hypothetical protein
VPRVLIAETIDVIAMLSGRGNERRLAELVRVEGQASSGDYVLSAKGSICRYSASFSQQTGLAVQSSMRWKA